jgi:hypothetical protein
LNIAVCDILSRKNSVYLPFFENFYPFVQKRFIENIDKLLEFAVKKNEQFKKQEVNFKTGFYSMSINVDYNKVIQNLNELKNIV